MKKISVLFSGIILLVFLLMIGCQDPSSEGPTAVETNSAGITSGTPQVLSKSYSGINAPQLQKELALARSATARYHTLDSAIADGYADIDIVVQNMGYHYMNTNNVKDTFDPAKPALLVYSKNPVNGKMRLVAVEYAIPNTDPRPEGFTGNADVWENNPDFGLWLCHAWVWYNNPNGIFNEFNPRVHVAPGDVTYPAVVQ
jgi:hypothetical protein